MPAQIIPIARSKTRSVGYVGFLALGFGYIVGSGWVMLLGEWLGRAGPYGTLAALVAGAITMVFVALTYGELASRVPVAGADYVYVRAAFGRRAGFLAGWFVLLFLLLVVAFEGIVLGWIVETIFPVLRSVPMYVVASESVTVDALIIALFGLTLIVWLNIAGINSAVRFQTWVTGLFLAIATACLIGAAGLSNGRGLPELDTKGSVVWSGAVWVFSTCIFFYNGFQAIPQLVEDRHESVTFHKLGWLIAGSVLAAALFYLMVVIATSVAAPWKWTVKQPLPAAAAVDASIAGLGSVLLVAAAVSVMKTWNAVFISAVQTIVALSRDGILPARLRRANAAGAHTTAIGFVTIANIGGLLMGRGAVSAVIGMASIATGIVIAACCAGAYQLRRRDGPAPFQMPGGLVGLAIAFLGTTLMALAALSELAFKPGSRTELFLMLGWLIAGAAFYRFSGAHRGAIQESRSSFLYEHLK